MRSLLRGEPDTVFRCAGRFILAGMFLWFASSRLEIPGAISAVFSIGLGAAGGMMRGWRTESGLWMLAGLFLCIDCGIYGLMLYGKVADFVRGAPVVGVGLVVDVGIATSLLSSTIRFLWRVARYNWTLTK